MFTLLDTVYGDTATDFALYALVLSWFHTARRDDFVDLVRSMRACTISRHRVPLGIVQAMSHSVLSRRRCKVDFSRHRSRSSSTLSFKSALFTVLLQFCIYHACLKEAPAVFPVAKSTIVLVVCCPAEHKQKLVDTFWIMEAPLILVLNAAHSQSWVTDTQ